MRYVLILLLSLLLLGSTPKPGVVDLERATILVQAPANVVQPLECTYDIATAKVQRMIYDPANAPFGHIRAWSCLGSNEEVDRELNRRMLELQAEAKVYRELHPMRSTANE